VNWRTENHYEREPEMDNLSTEQRDTVELIKRVYRARDSWLEHTLVLNDPQWPFALRTIAATELGEEDEQEEREAQQAAEIEAENAWLKAAENDTRMYDPREW